MDPNKTLKDARGALSSMMEAKDAEVFQAHAWQLLDAFATLDEWLSDGGYLPADWQGRK